MTADELSKLLPPVLARLIELAHSDDELRGRLRQLGEALVAFTAERAEAASESSPTPAIHRVLNPDVETPAKAISEPIAFEDEGFQDDSFEGDEHPDAEGDAQRIVVRPAWQDLYLEQVADRDLADIVERCKLKAEAAREMAEWLRSARDAAAWTNHKRQVEGLIAQARALPDCYLLLNLRELTSDNPAIFDMAAGCFDAAAAVVGLLHDIVIDTDVDLPLQLEQAMNLAAEAQSALLQAVRAITYSTDRDQLRVFYWLRGTGIERRIFMPRYMRKDDPADPELWTHLRRRIDELAANVHKAQTRRRTKQQMMNKVRYHVKAIRSSPLANHIHDWRAVFVAVSEMVNTGTPPSDVDIRDALLPIVEDMPEDLDLPPSMQLVWREIDRYLSSTQAQLSSTDQEETYSDDVKRVAEWLRGRSVLIIGGNKRPGSARALEHAFGLKELLWPDALSHQSHRNFEPYIMRGEVAAVLLAIRWASHNFGEVKAACDEHDKPLVRLRAGYNPNEVARQIMAQASHRLNEI